ncbi:MAG: threonine-phosphate decarboxylase CobD [Verrucomicrobiota bacterium]|nr:threonine-phosphate decarboxylase CobD [Verrucomicrobiota bacterium]
MAEALKREPHGGNLRALSEAGGLPPSRILDFSANINPLGPVPALSAVLGNAFDDILRYPDPDNVRLVDAIHRRFRWPLNRIAVGNGASELLHALCRSLGCSRALIPAPSYSDYAAAAERAGMRVALAEMDEAAGFEIPWKRLATSLRDNDLVILGNPNNPTGRAIDGDALYSFVKLHPKGRFIVDESFLEFVPGAESIADRLPINAVMLRSMTKFYAIPGLRLGFVVAAPRLASALRGQLPPWNVNCLAHRAGIVSLANRAYARRTRAVVARARREFVAELRKFAALRVYESDASFILLRIVKHSLNGFALGNKLLRQRIAIRVCSNFAGLDARYFRVAVRLPAENGRLIKALHAALED